MKLTRDDLMDIFAKASAEEVRMFSEAMELTPLQEFSLVMFLGTILDKVENEIFK